MGEIYNLHKSEKSQLEQFAIEYQKTIRNAVDVANNIRPHVIGGATKKEIAIRTGWDMELVEKMIKLLKSIKILGAKNDKFFIDFDEKNIFEKIQRERGFFHQRLFELDILQKYFIKEKDSERIPSQTSDTFDIKNDIK